MKYSEISKYFNTDELTTHRIAQNLCFGFFIEHFGEDSEKAWKEAHPFKCVSCDLIDYRKVDLSFIKKHFELFAGLQLTTFSGWEWNEKTNRPEWTYRTFYRKAEIIFI